MKFPLSKRRTPQRGSSTALGSTLRPTPKTVLPKPRPHLGWSDTILAHEAVSKAAFLAAFEGLEAFLNLPSSLAAIESGRLDNLLDLFDLLHWADFETNLATAMSERVRDVVAFEGARSYGEARLMVDSGSGAAAAGGKYPPNLPPTTFGDPVPEPGPRSGVYATTRFDMVDPYAIRAAEQFAADLVREVTASTRKAINEAVVASFREGIPVDALKRRLRNTVGLTSRQAAAVESYRLRLLNGGMDADRVDVLTRRYFRKTLNRRCETIARTEIMRASNHGRLQGWLSASDHGMLDKNLSTKEWVTAPHGSSYGPPCPVCLPLDGVKVMGIETPFNLPNGRQALMPPGHPNCRCTAIVWPPEPPEDYDPDYSFAQV